MEMDPCKILRISKITTVNVKEKRNNLDHEIQFNCENRFFTV